jgi:hypothetical protein
MASREQWTCSFKDEGSMTVIADESQLRVEWKQGKLHSAFTHYTRDGFDGHLQQIRDYVTSVKGEIAVETL